MFLTQNSVLNLVKHFIRNQLVHVVALGEPFYQFGFVFVDAPGQIVGNTGIEHRIVSIGEDVNAILPFHGDRFPPRFARG